jgi:hypothetical protein
MEAREGKDFEWEMLKMMLGGWWLRVEDGWRMEERREKGQYIEG